jgi:hypothetical protein
METNLINTLIKLEPIFREAGDIAYKMQKHAKQSNKFDTGNELVDIVTDADLEVQEFLLKKMAKTALVDCRLLAEENTPSTRRFNPKGKVYLGIDPIDATSIYSRGGKFFNLVVSLHDGKDFLYTFKHFPALKWTHRIVHNKYTVYGRTPSFNLPPQAKTSIPFLIPWNPEKIIPKLYKGLVANGYNFVVYTDLTNDYGTTEMLICKQIAGRYVENPNAYDGLVSLHFAQAKKLKIYTGGPKGKLDLTIIKKRKIGFYYPGYFLVLNKRA